MIPGLSTPVKTFNPLEMDGHRFVFPEPGTEEKENNDIQYVLGDMAQQKSIWEPNTTKTVKQYLKKGQVAVDLGASVGYFTLLFARQVGRNGKVFSFEATPYRFKYMCKNVEENGYKDWVFPFHIAAWNNKEEILMPPQNDTFKVQADTIDNVLEENGITEVDFIKSDTDGNELKVLKGLERTIQRSKNLKMVFEYFPAYIEAQKESPKEVMEFIETYFTHSVIEGDYNDGRLVNLFCVRK